MSDLTQAYLNMQKNQYEEDASRRSIFNKDPVVGSYDAHNQWSDYDTYLFKDFDTKNLVALEYGCGPGRNLVKFNTRFQQIDGVDIAQTNLEKARSNLAANSISTGELYLCDGKSIPVGDNKYDVVFSTICLQHIACYDVRFSIFQEVYRVLKKGGRFCFQIGLDNGENVTRPHSAKYFDNMYNAPGTNGVCDVLVTDENELKNDLTKKIKFKKYQSDIRPTGPGDFHHNWIWVQVQK